MSSKRKRLNISLVFLSLILGGWVARLYRLPPPSHISPPPADIPSILSQAPADNIDTASPASHDIIAASPSAAPSDTTAAMDIETPRPRQAPSAATRFSDVRISALSADNPFRAEATKILSGRLEETDSASRHKILNYCEHLRTSYTTRDIDFIRQVFSEDALIIVGHVVKPVRQAGAILSSEEKVRYTVRSKQEYIARLERIFASSKELDIRFSGFRILRHPTIPGIYGVTLRQAYRCDSYADDGYLFLLWDFRNPSMPLIHVRTWQPSRTLAGGEDDLIGISDFNLE